MTALSRLDSVSGNNADGGGGGVSDFLEKSVTKV